MRFLVLVSLVSLVAAGCQMRLANEDRDVRSSPTVLKKPDNRIPVLVELFTSEGCSSCPPAERNLAFLDTQTTIPGVEVVTLEFHVDYWDRLGWKDPFSSPTFTMRQANYANSKKLSSTYTPQMIVDGQAEFVGSQAGLANDEIVKAAAERKAEIDVVVSGTHLRLHVTDVPKHGAATVFVAVAESGLTSRVEAGENSGMTLEHVSVVRILEAPGVLEVDSSELKLDMDLNLEMGWNQENLKVVVFIQEIPTGRVIGVRQVKLNGASDL